MIATLFSQGKSINAFPIRAVYMKQTAEKSSTINTGVVVSKKNIRLAVNRNLIKRRMREAYRLNNQELKAALEQSNTGLRLMLIYVGKEPLPYATIETKIKAVLKRLSEIK